MQSDAIALEHSLAVYEKIEYSLTIRPRNPTPGSFYPTEIKMRVTAKTHTWMFIAALFVITKNWKPKRHLTGEQINSAWYSHTTRCI